MMNDGRDRLNTRFLSEADVEEAGLLLRAGSLVVLPTETVYGLAANARDRAAVAGIFLAKGRPSDNPLIVHFADVADVARELPDTPRRALELLERFAPGPLTVVVPVTDRRGRRAFPEEVTAGLSTVGVRVPAHPLARAILGEAGVPVAAPSANRSGRPSPTTFAMAVAEMSGRVAAIVDGGNCRYGLESTVVLVEGDAFRVLRPGAVTPEMIAVSGLRPLSREGATEIPSRHTAAAPGGRVAPGDATASTPPPAPGMKYTHYRPSSPVVLADETAFETIVTAPETTLGAISLRLPGGGAEPGHLISVGAIGYDRPSRRSAGNRRRFPAGIDPVGVELVYVPVRDSREYAEKLFRTFHELDTAGVDLIVAELPDDLGIGGAVRDRLQRASGGTTIRI